METEVKLTALGQAAIDYAKMGLAVFPLAEGSKVPAIAGGFKNATTDIDQILAFWQHRPNANIGIATGGMSGGLLVIDCDYDEMRGEDGMATVRAHEAANGEFPDGACVSTPRGGEHLYFMTDEPFDCSTDAEAGVDIRGDGGYVVAPPSIHPNGGVYEWDMHYEDYGIPKATASVLAFVRKLQGKKRGEPFKLPENIQKGERNDTIFKLACSMQARGDEDGVIYAYCTAINTAKCMPPMSDGEVRKVVEQALRYQKGEGRKRTPGNVGHVSTMLRVNDKGNPFQTISNCETVLLNDVRLAGRFSYNTMAYTKMVECPLPWDESSELRAIRDSDYASLTAYMEREYMLTSKDKAIDAVLTTCMSNRKNPVAEWLSTLRWDGIERVHTLLPMFLGAAETDYNTEVMRLFMRAAVARVLHPGCKFDHMMVLHGEQGIGKSTFLRRLAHDSHWFDGNFNTVEGDAAVEKLRGMWIVEMAELLSVKRTKDVEAVKSFITNQVDTIRPKYARETEQRPRVCVLAGTTNADSFLSDPTGNRRFLPVECTFEKPERMLFDDVCQQHFDACWAETYAKYMDGDDSLELPASVARFADDMRMRYSEDDPRIGLIQDYVDGVIASAVDPKSIRICAVEVLENALRLDEHDCKNPPRRLINEIHEIMRNKIDGLLPYGNSEGKARTRYGVQKCYVIDLGSPYVAELRQHAL